MMRLPALALALLALATPAPAQVGPVAWRSWPLDESSGRLDGQGDAPRVACERVVSVPGATWLRLTFAGTELGARSRLRLWSLADGGEQVLRESSLGEWEDTSAIFNGDTVVVQLEVAPEDSAVHLELGPVLVGTPRPDAQRSLCGADDRAAILDDRVGRLFLGGCTAWRATNGALLSAGHCASSFAAGDVVEFRVPPSQPDGTPVAADPADQYPVDLASVVDDFGPKGADWAVFGVLPNANTGLLPHQAYGIGLRATREAPGGGATLRVTGFGIDASPPGSSGGANAQNVTEQTATGKFQGEGSSGSGRIWIDHDVDATSGDSGAPIVRVDDGLAIGLHTTSGCDAGSHNSGTSFELDALENALQTFPGPLVCYLDGAHPLPVAPDGTVFRPYADLGAAASHAPASGLVSIVPASYPAAAGNAVTITGAVTLTAPNGVVVLGD